MAIDPEFAHMLAFAHNRHLKSAIQSLYMRSPGSLSQRGEELHDFAAEYGLEIRPLDIPAHEVAYVLWPKRTTRAKPACIVVSDMTQVFHSPMCAYTEFLGVGSYNVMEQGFVKVAGTSEGDTVRPTKKGAALWD